MNDVAFAGARGFAVGQEGTVLRSDDGGRTWVELPSETQNTLSQVQALDANTVVVGGGCTLRESMNGGASFERLAVTESEKKCASQVASFSFLTRSSGFIELSDGEVLLTNDAGRTFEPRQSARGASGHVGKITFLSPTTGLALTSGENGGEIRRTVDGANVWKTVYSSPSSLSDVAFVTPTTAYAVSANGMLLRSTDAGATWQAQPLTLPAGTPLLSFGRIACGDALHCLISIDSLNASLLVRTSDGGMTGSLVTPSEEANLLGPALLPVTSVAFPTPSTAVAVGKEGATFISDDAGASFHQQVYNLLEGVPNNRRMRLGQSPLDAYMALEAPEIAATTDGGLSWSVLRVPTSSEIVDFAFPTIQVGYAVNKDGTLFKTTTAGRTWSILPSVGAAPSALLAPNINTVVVIRGGGVTRSTDGGASFESFDPTVVIDHRGRPNRAKLSAFDISNGAELAGGAIFAFGDPLAPPQGVYTDSLLESTDGGLHWTRLRSPVPREGPAAISFVNSTTGYETSAGRLFFTRNRGRTWKQILSLGSSTETIFPPVNLSFSSPRLGDILVNEEQSGYYEPSLLRTEDGGRSWVPQQLPGVLSQVRAGGAVDYVVGESYDAIFRTAHGGRSSNSSTLTLGIVGAHRLSASKLRRKGGTVKLIGHLRPAAAGAEVTVSNLVHHHFFWHHQTATVNAKGVFALTVSGISATTGFVAQWNGTDLLGGAGTPVVQLTVTQ